MNVELTEIEKSGKQPNMKTLSVDVNLFRHFLEKAISLAAVVCFIAREGGLEKGSFSCRSVQSPHS
jgi:hypothetical protein